jgi:hypothetical protein
MISGNFLGFGGGSSGGGGMGRNNRSGGGNIPFQQIGGINYFEGWFFKAISDEKKKGDKIRLPRSAANLYHMIDQIEQPMKFELYFDRLKFSLFVGLRDTDAP